MEMQLLELNRENDLEPPELLADEPIGFWRQQFLQRPTKKQNVFDWSYGVVIPLICVTADPIVFVEGGLLEDYQTFAFLLSSTSIMAMAAWLLWGYRLRWLCSPMAGFFIAGSSVSFVVAVLIFPYSLVGLFFLIGFLGFTPLFSALVFFRNGIRALRSADACLESRVVWQWAVLGAMFGLVIPYVMHIYMNTTSSYTSLLMP